MPTADRFLEHLVYRVLLKHSGQCAYCGMLFIALRKGRKKYCSKRCVWLAWSKRSAEPKNRSK